MMTDRRLFVTTLREFIIVVWLGVAPMKVKEFGQKSKRFRGLATARFWFYLERMQSTTSSEIFAAGQLEP